VAFDAEAGGGKRLNAGGAPCQFKDFAAGPAVEVVVVGLACEFVTRGVAGEVDGGEEAILEHGGEGAVDGSGAEAGGFTAGGGEHLSGGERPTLEVKDAGDGGALSGMSLIHAWQGGGKPEL
jgi:hypothetical protein